MTTATDKHLQCWGNATYNRVETEREIPKLEFNHVWVWVGVAIKLENQKEGYDDYLYRIPIWKKEHNRTDRSNDRNKDQ